MRHRGPARKARATAAMSWKPSTAWGESPRGRPNAVQPGPTEPSRPDLGHALGDPPAAFLLQGRKLGRWKKADERLLIVVELSGHRTRAIDWHKENLDGAR